VNSGSTIPDTTELTITPKATGAPNNQSVRFILNGVRAGANGDPVTMYELMPSVNAIKCDKTNTLTPTSFDCSVQKITGDTVSTAASTDGTLRYRIDNDITASTDGTALAIGGTISGYTSSNRYIVLAFFDTDGTMRDKERILIVADGTDGENTAQLTMDNEHEDFLYNDAGTLIAPQNGATSNVHFFDGNTEKTTDVGWALSVDGGSNYHDASRAERTGSMASAKLFNRLLTVSNIYASTAKVIVRAEYPTGIYYYKEFTANKTNQDKYDLDVKPNAITYNPATYPSAAGTGTSIALGGWRIDLAGNRTQLTFGAYDDATKISTTENKGYLRLFIGIYQSPAAGVYAVIPTQQRETPFIANKYQVSHQEYLHVELRKYTNKDSSNESGYTLVDYEDIEIAKVENGQAGADGKYDVSEYAISDSRSSHDSSHIDTSTGTSPIDYESGWTSTAQPTTATYPYIWKRTCQYDPSTEDYVKDEYGYVIFSYVCETGDKGDEGNAYTLRTSPSQLTYNPNNSGSWVGASGFSVERLDNGVSSNLGTIAVYPVDANNQQGSAITPTQGVYSAVDSQSYSRFDVVWTIPNNVVVASVSVPIIKFGDEDEVGHVGRWYYFADDYDPTTTYTLEDTQAPYVKYNGNFYMLDNEYNHGVNGSWRGATPANDGNPWTLMNSTHQYYIAKAMFADQAYFGSFIINHDWMISQDGGPTGKTYSDFRPSDFADYVAGTNPTYNGFIPNFAVDGATGTTYQNAAHVRGEINALTGTIGGFVIDSTTIKDANSNPVLYLDSYNKKIVAGSLEIQGAQQVGSGYTWTGIASVINSLDVMTLGGRKYTDGQGDEGHLRLGGQGEAPGIMDFIAGRSDSLIQLGTSLNKIGLEIDGISAWSEKSGKIKLRNCSGSTNVDTIISNGYDGSITLKSPSDQSITSTLTHSKVETGIVKATTAFVAGNVIYGTSWPSSIAANTQVIVVETNTTYNPVTINFTPTGGEGSILVIKKIGTDGFFKILNASGKCIGIIQEAGSLVCVYRNNEWY
jgi:hypothetical protein